MNNVDIVKKWISKYVIELDLCPFAIKPFRTNKINYIDFTIDKINDLEDVLVNFISQTNNFETTLIIISELVQYDAFLDFYYGLEDILDQIDRFHVIKLVGFHPEYKHGNITDSVLDYSNVAPLPIIQLLNKNDVNLKSKFIHSESILMKNEITLKNKGTHNLQKLIDELRREN